ncbi:hypothetical protein POF50_031930 [Streptomyces sp. SL13]|uniref:Uncharacterized protein n=1 Tax=Streptantibioticus silvisoli TaxID=2705255 RepID=A0AA90H5H4_9ACTN|nr:hypothetical protein [Streptantibioticus silvisoli]MDI5966825.1 hypothetical protein [Streptantibioticus silvisoli]MDI5973899.1 hypothetical protein [Streptantibioticus silvisoli]
MKERSALTGLTAGERLLVHEVVVVAKGAKGAFTVHAPGMRPLTAGVRREIMDIGSSTGGWNSIAGQMPATGGSALVMRVTDQRLGLVTVKEGSPVWEVPRSWAARIERRPRLQLMARFRVHFVDGSWAAFYTVRRRTVRAFAAELGGRG